MVIFEDKSDASAQAEGPRTQNTRLHPHTNFERPFAKARCLRQRPFGFPSGMLKLTPTGAANNYANDMEKKHPRTTPLDMKNIEINLHNIPRSQIRKIPARVTFEDPVRRLYSTQVETGDLRTRKFVLTPMCVREDWP